VSVRKDVKGISQFNSLTAEKVFFFLNYFLLFLFFLRRKHKRGKKGLEVENRDWDG